MPFFDFFFEENILLFCNDVVIVVFLLGKKFKQLKRLAKIKGSMKKISRLLTLLAIVVVFIGLGYMFGKIRNDYNRAKEHQSLLNHLNSMIQAVDDQIVNNRMEEGQQPALFNRLRNQLSTLEDLYKGRYYFTIRKDENLYKVALCSKTNSEYKKGDTYSLDEKAELEVFGHHKPFVEEVMQDGKLQKIKVFVPITRIGEKYSTIAVVMELKGKSYAARQLFLRKQTYFAFAILGLVIILTVAATFWRSDLPAEKRNRFVHIETFGFFFVGLWIVLVAGYLYRVSKNQEHQLIFNNYGASSATIVRAAFREIGHHLEELGIFIANSEDIDDREFENCAKRMLNKDAFEAVFFFESSQPVSIQPSLRLIAADGSQLFLKYHHETNIQNGLILLNDPIIMDSLQHFLSQSHTDNLIHSTGYIKPAGTNSQGVIILGYAIPQGPCDGRHNRYQRFLVAVIDPQRIIENTFRNADWIKMDMASDMLQFENQTKTTHIASFPQSHYRASSSAELDAHFAQVEFVKANSLFIWGDFYVMKLHSLEGYHAASFGLRTSLFYLASFVMLLMVTLLIFFYRRHSQTLELLVEKRTHDLDRRVRDLVCIRNITQMLQSGNEMTTNLENAAYELENTLFPNNEAYIEVQIDGIKTSSSGKNAGKLIAASFDLIRNQRLIGSLKVKSTEPVRLQEEDLQLLSQIATKISNYLNHFHVNKELKDSETKFRSLVENAFDAIYIFADRRFFYVNKAFCEMVGYTEQELTSSEFDINVLLTPYSKAIVDQHISDRRKGIAVPKRYEFQQLAKGGRVVDVEASTVSVELDGKTVTIGMLHDITARKQAQAILTNSEERLQQQNEELHVLNEELYQTNDQMRQMNADLIDAKQKAEASDRLKTAFLNNISHELRTPLNGILGAASVILEGGIDSPEERIEMDAVLSLSTNRLVRTIEQYVDISMLTSSTMPLKYEKLQPLRLMENLVRNFKTLCKHKNLHFETEILVDEDVSLETDRNLMLKIVEHLLDNAVKFTHDGFVRLQVSRNAAENLVVEVSDSGIGIQDDFRSHIYDLFMQQDISTVRRYDGSGLGLSIVKRCCDILGATLRFDSVVGKGTTFTVEFPVAKTPKPVPVKTTMAVKEHEPIELKDATILIAEDEDSNFAVLDVVLVKRLRLKILRAENGLEAVDLCREHPEISLCLMDIKMPVMDGYEATRLIKQIRPGLPVIAITAFGLVDDDRKALAAGCDDYLAKPFQVNSLLAKVGQWLAVAHQNHEKTEE